MHAKYETCVHVNPLSEASQYEPMRPVLLYRGGMICRPVGFFLLRNLCGGETQPGGKNNKPMSKTQRPFLLFFPCRFQVERWVPNRQRRIVVSERVVEQARQEDTRSRCLSLHHSFLSGELLRPPRQALQS